MTYNEETYSAGIRKYLKILLLFCSSFPVMAEKPDTLFMSEDIIKMELRSDFSQIQKDRTGEATYHDAELIYYTPDKKEVKLNVRIMVRGNFRRDPTHCNFPPLFVNFKKSDVKHTVFENQTKLKLVTHCQFEEDLIEEYTIYKMYNQITDRSFKTRLARITYYDTGLDKKLFEKYSFFLEDKEHLAERINSSEQTKFYTPFDLDQENVKKLSIFEYMIGNKDWFISSRKNIVIMQPEDTAKHAFAVPYDFDFAAIVNAGYTKPKGIPDSLLADRKIYKGLCYPVPEINAALDYFKTMKPIFEKIINRQKLMSLYDRSQFIIYLDQFYDEINDEKAVREKFSKTCETKKDYNITN